MFCFRSQVNVPSEIVPSEKVYYKVSYVMHGGTFYSSNLTDLKTARSARNSILFREDVSDVKIIEVIEVTGKDVVEKVVE